MIKTLKYFLLFFLFSGLTMLINGCGGVEFKYDKTKTLTYENLDYGYNVKYLDMGDRFGKIAYVDEGQGNQTLVFLHGITIYLKYFSKQIDYLKQHYRVIALDMPGYGKSTYLNTIAYSPPYHILGVSNFIKKLKLKNVVLCGLSYGGGIAVGVTRSRGIDIKKLILISPWGLQNFKRDDVIFFRKNFNNNVKINVTADEMINNWFENYIYKKNNTTNHLLKEFLALIHSKAYIRSRKVRYKVLKASLRGDRGMLIKIFKSLKIPILLIAGKKDNIIPLYQRTINTRPYPPAFYKSVSKMNKRCTLKLIENCGHIPNIEYPQIVNETIHNFLKNSL